MGKAGHRPGQWKQQNKKHNTGAHRSKGAIRKSVSGAVSSSGSMHSGKSSKASSKMARKASALSFRHKKEETSRVAYRPIHLIFFPLGDDTNAMEITHANLQCSGACEQTVGGSYQLALDRKKFNITRPNDISSLLVQSQVCDALVLTMRYSDDFLRENIKLLEMLAHGVGLPQVFLAIQGLSEIPAAKVMAARNEVLKRFKDLNVIPCDKMKTFPVDTIDQTKSLLRQIATVRQTARGHINRPFMLAEKIAVDGEDLKISGYLSRGLSVNLPIHVPGVGDFLIKQVEDKHGEVIKKSKEDKLPNLNPEAEVDMLDAEQTFPTEDELKDAENPQAQIVKRKVPKGYSAYQAAWIPDDDIESGNEDDIIEEEDENMDDDIPDLEGDDDREYFEDEDKVIAEMDSGMGVDSKEEEEDDEEDKDGSKYDKNYDYDQEQQFLSLHRKAKDDRAFPDEIDTPQDARTRLQKYRGLTSFRTSPWDKNENLPADYARVFKFKRWAHAKIRAKKWVPEIAETVAAGQMVTLVLKIREENKAALRAIGDMDSLVIFGLLANEHKMSVMHFVMKKANGFDAEIANKSELYFTCGFRRFKARPIFSQHTNGNKHKMERFLPIDKTRIVMSCYAPIMFPPQGVLAFAKDSSGNFKLAATGSILSSDPDRINLKRIVLSGAPFKINKKSCVCRFMFFNRLDIQWFKPLELRSKYGRRGHIKEPVGTHGHFKAVFDQHLTSMDTVLMTLYKRVYPKWTYESVPKLDGELLV